MSDNFIELKSRQFLSAFLDQANLKSKRVAERLCYLVTQGEVAHNMIVVDSPRTQTYELFILIVRSPQFSEMYPRYNIRIGAFEYSSVAESSVGTLIHFHILKVVQYHEDVHVMADRLHSRLIAAGVY